MPSVNPGSPATSLVVFCADAKQLGTIDVALGPCMRAPAQRRRLVSPLMQDNGETPEQASALFSVLTARPASEALSLLTASGDGRLFKCSDDFLNAMADQCEAMLAIPDLDGFANERERLSSAWMQATRWPDRYVSVKNRLGRLSDARAARQKGLPLYFWFGPPVSMRSVVAGTGPYRRRL
jgi:hypothetical protein